MALTMLRRSVLLLLAASAAVLAVSSITGATPAPDAPVMVAEPASAAAPTDVLTADRQVTLDVVGLTNLIVSAASNAADRDAFVRSALDKVSYFKLSNGRSVSEDYNVMVFNRQQPFSSNLAGIEMYSDFRFDNITFGVWVFKSGWFLNEGDGGWINWAFRGWFTRSGSGGKLVTFRAK